MTAHVSRNSGNVEWYTPPVIIDAARATMGGIDLDPASCAEAQGNVRAVRYYSSEDDGLAQPWRGRVWLNPPYSRGLCSAFALRLLLAYRSGEAGQAVWLSNNSTETAWCQALLSASSALCLPAGRVKYLAPGMMERRVPLQGQIVLYFGHRIGAFLRHFGPLGSVALCATQRNVCTDEAEKTRPSGGRMNRRSR